MPKVGLAKGADQIDHTREDVEAMKTRDGKKGRGKEVVPLGKGRKTHPLVENQMGVFIGLNTEKDGPSPNRRSQPLPTLT